MSRKLEKSWGINLQGAGFGSLNSENLSSSVSVSNLGDSNLIPGARLALSGKLTISQLSYIVNSCLILRFYFKWKYYTNWYCFLIENEKHLP